MALHANEIIPGLWVSAWPDYECDIPALRALGVKILVFAARERQPTPAAERLYQRAGMLVVRAPLDDALYMTSGEEQTALTVATLVAAAVLKGEKTMVTCQQGVNRSALIAALALRGAKGMPARKAIDLVRHRRVPRDLDFRVLGNETFVKLIENASFTHVWSKGQPGGAFAAIGHAAAANGRRR